MSTLLSHFVTEKVIIMLNSSMTVQTEEGLSSIPICIEGYFIDLDEEFVLIESEDGQTSLVARAEILKIDHFNEQSHALSDPEKPDRGDMN